MHIRTFRAPTLQDALANIRHEMGPTASVLHTRRIPAGLWGILGRTQIEVTAGVRDYKIHANESPHGAITSDQFCLPGEDSSPRMQAVNVRDLENVAHASNRLGSASASQGNHRPFTHSGHSDLLQRLLDSGIVSSVAHRWVERVQRSTTDTTAGLRHGLLDSLRQVVASEVAIGSPIQVEPNERRIVALVGPTGVGKTTTIAKLAANHRLRHQHRVGLVTIDTFRIAAVEQLRSYAQIMDLPMEVVERPEEMPRALGRLGDLDLILIDTAGRSPRSEARIEQLFDFMNIAHPHETHLVLGANMASSAIARTLKGFAPVNPTSIIVTKLDEIDETAELISSIVPAISGNSLTSSHQTSLPLSYLTDGQQVPDDIAPATLMALLDRLISEPVSQSRMSETAA
ncbi:MAG: flagellar biosynthesis protein FlhF [Planctomycetota bacterium]